MFSNKLITLLVSAVLLPAMGGAAALAAAAAPADPFVKPGFEVVEHKGRMWVFREGSDALAEFRAKGVPAKHVVRPAAGPNRTTLRGIDSETLNEYIATRPGFVVIEHKGSLWVFRAGSQELTEFRAKGTPAKHVVRPAAGPMGMTLRSVESDILNEYIAAKPGFVAIEHKGSLWIFHEGSKELAEFRAKGTPAKHVVRPAAGPMGMTLRAVESEILTEYLAAKPGFVTIMQGGRLWVFREGSKELAEYRAKGAPARHVIRPAAGPMALTLRAVDVETIDAYLSL